MKKSARPKHVRAWAFTYRWRIRGRSETRISPLLRSRSDALVLRSSLFSVGILEGGIVDHFGEVTSCTFPTQSKDPK